MTKAQTISFSKQYVLEVAIAEIRKRHNIPEEFATELKDYSENYLSFKEVATDETTSTDEMII